VCADGVLVTPEYGRDLDRGEAVDIEERNDLRLTFRQLRDDLPQIAIRRCEVNIAVSFGC
jgi:hypothetical protein